MRRQKARSTGAHMRQGACMYVETVRVYVCRDSARVRM